MVNHSEVYEKLAEKYGRAGSEHFVELLKVMMTPEEGK